jgi:carbonic anhydrase
MHKKTISVGQEDAYQQLLINNKAWVATRLAVNPDYFINISKGQMPTFFMIGCSDSRAPLGELTQSELGTIFTVRNVANQVSLTDVNSLAAIHLAVNALQVKHIIVCGHYQCRGIIDTLAGPTSELVEACISPITHLYYRHKEMLDTLSDKDRADKLSEMNVVDQLERLCKTSLLQQAFLRPNYPLLHGWIYNIYKGLLEELPLPLKEWRRLGLIPENYPIPEAS